MSVPALPGGEILFAPLLFDAELAAVEARRRGVWAHPQLAEQLWPPDERPVRPLMPLRKGHLALLIAAGLLNNVVLLQNGQRVLVKGRRVKCSAPRYSLLSHCTLPHFRGPAGRRRPTAYPGPSGCRARVGARRASAG